MTQVIDAAALRRSIQFFGRSTHWLLMPWRYRVAATIAYAEVWHCGRPIDGMFGCTFGRPLLKFHIRRKGSQSHPSRTWTGRDPIALYGRYLQIANEMRQGYVEWLVDGQVNQSVHAFWNRTRW